MVRAYSKQGINIAFIGLDEYAQASCAGYLKRKQNFKQMNLDDGLRHFLRTTYGYHEHFTLNRSQVRKFYDNIYKLDRNIWINHFARNFANTDADVVVKDARYLNEMEKLKDLGFKIVRVTSQPRNRKNIVKFVGEADKGTVALSMLFDKSFATNYNVDYSVNFTNLPNLSAIIDPVLEDLGYKFDI